MAIRKVRFEKNKYYHICNRSNDGNPIFLDQRDWIRCLFFIIAYQAPLPFYNIGRQISYFQKYSRFNLNETLIEQIAVKRKVELNIFAIMPNHFHLLLKENTEDGSGISWYLQRIQVGCAKYYNAKYKKNGHLFQGAFRAIPIENDEQLLYLSAYIHRNPRELLSWRNKEHQYPWSSYQDCINGNRWGKLLVSNIVSDQFSTKNLYRDFINSSSAKLKNKDFSVDNLFLE